MDRIQELKKDLILISKCIGINKIYDIELLKKERDNKEKSTTK